MKKEEDEAAYKEEEEEDKQVIKAARRRSFNYLKVEGGVKNYVYVKGGLKGGGEGGVKGNGGGLLIFNIKFASRRPKKIPFFGHNKKKKIKKT